MEDIKNEFEKVQVRNLEMRVIKQKNNFKILRDQKEAKKFEEIATSKVMVCFLFEICQIDSECHAKSLEMRLERRLIKIFNQRMC